ncbi:MAG: hypothetical protein AABX33_04935 [Nanoarchaeota archaeon]
MIKPFGFIAVGFGTKTMNKKTIKPLTPFRSDSQEVPHLPFIDAETGDSLEGIEYWNSLSDILLSYINHPESKLDGDTGILSRKKVHITDVSYIGKEASNLEYAGKLAKLEYNPYIDSEKQRERLLYMTTAEARKIGIAKSTLSCIKKRAKQGKQIKLRIKTLNKLSG